MFKFLRKLRRKLIEEGNAKKYLYYALGEILLVVIGILIALQINALNQKRLDRNAAARVLSRMTVDLDADYNRLTFIDSTYAKQRQEIREFYAILAMDRINDKELLRKASFFHGADIKDVNSVRATFDEMVNSGNIYKLENDSLIKQIIEYYRKVDENLFQSREDRREFRRFLYSPEMLDYFYIRSASKNTLEIASQFFEDPDSKNYKRLVQAVNWSGGLISRGKSRNTELIERNRSLKKSIMNEIEQK